MRRGQAAMEFLLTYGWALLALLVSIGTIALLTDGFGSWAPDVCSLSQPFVCLESKAQLDGVVLLGIQNAGEDMSDLTVTLTCDDGQPVQYVSASTLKINERVNGTLRLACPPPSGRFTGRIALAYRNAGESVWHNATGRLSLTPEP